VVAITDTRYSGEEITELLKRHNVQGVAKVYSSADHRVNKFSGRLFDVVLQNERRRRGRFCAAAIICLRIIFHRAQRGLNVRHTRRPPPPYAPPITACDAAKGGQRMAPQPTRLILGL